MSNYVIKGRGKNRGQYLCYARMAGLSPSDKYVWLPEQKKAARFDDPRYNHYSYQARIVAEYDGYFVKLTARKSIITRVPELKTFIAEHAFGAKERLNCYWLDGDWNGDEGSDYCWSCACKEVDAAFTNDPKTFADLYGDQGGDRTSAEDYYEDAIRGGYSMDHDSLPHCEGADCGIALDGTLTDYGADEEIRALTKDYQPRFDNAESWYCMDRAVMNIPNDDPRWNKIARVIDKAIKQEKAYAEHLAAIATSPGMTDVRESLLSLLEARKEQKAPEPSYQHWDELLAWIAIPFEQRYNPKDPALRALERKLFKAAFSFANDLSFPMRGDCIGAPYGTYFWPYVVQTEQYRLWGTKAFKEGEALGLLPWSDSRKTKSANPYPDDTAEHVQWERGFAGAISNERSES